MTLSKQLLILISALFLMIFAVNFFISVQNMKSYLQVEAEIHAQDTATSLGLSLSPYIENESDPILETMMKAIFDAGYYQEIKLTDVEGKPLVTLTNEKSFAEVPAWFVDFLPMKTASANSEISSGWTIGGAVSVEINPGYAYLKLYRQVKSAFYYSLAAFIVSMALLFVILRFILLPLKKIDHLARTIAGGKFETIQELPLTTEVRNVAKSMNFMSKKIEGVIDSLNAKLENLSKRLLLDELTGLPKKNSFETDMKKLFMGDAHGYVFNIKIDNLADLAKSRGADAVDKFVSDFSGVLKRVADEQDSGKVTVYRFFGSEFTLLAAHVDRPGAEALAQKVRNRLSELGSNYNKRDIAHIGIAPIDPIGTTAQILAAAGEAYEQAKLIGDNSYYFRAGDDQAKDIVEWKNLVFRIIDNRDYQVSFIGRIESIQTGETLMEEAFTQAFDEEGASIPIGTFVSVAEKFEKVVDLDQGVIERVIKHIKERQIGHAIAVNLSLSTIKDGDFKFWLVDLFKRHQDIAKQIVFSVTAYAAAKNLKSFGEFVDFAHDLGAGIILKRYEPQFISLDDVKEIRPDSIRLARDLTTGLNADISKMT
ncbi:MAG: LapD/MoxY N-terminal periplasmic domain-containing protein, partial [Gammaproteobacteria bacterium]